MNQQQFEKAKAVVERDAEITGYHYKDGKTCAIGGLLKFAGFPVQQLGPGGIGADNLEPARECLRRHYGLDGWQMRDIQAVNDSHLDKIEERRAALIAKLRTFVTE